jgi:hypothetical protein
VVAFVTALLITVVLVGAAMWYGSRRPVGKPITWGEAMLAGTFIFFVMFWAYGMVPHLWLTWADNELKWRPDKLLFGPGDIVKPQKFDGWNPITINYQTLRDLIVVGIYAIFLGFNIFAWAWWNDRGKHREERAKELETSDYGRPLVRS